MTTPKARNASVRQKANLPRAGALATLFTALSIATLPACESSGPKASAGNAELMSVRLTNQTDSPVRVLVSLGSREPATASEVWAINGPAITLAPKEATTYTLFADEASTRPSDDTYACVVRVRLENIRPSWAANEVYWYELANPAVKQILIERFELGGITVRSPQSRVAVMPRERQTEFGLE